MKKEKLLLLFIVTTVAATILIGCSSSEKALSEEISSSVQDDEYDFSNMSFTVKGYYEETFYHYGEDENSDINHFDVSFIGNIQDPQRIDDTTYSGIISNASYKTAGPVEVSATGKVITPVEEIEILPTVPFDEELMKKLLFLKTPTIGYEYDDDTSPTGHSLKEFDVSEDTITNIRFATIDDNTEENPDELMYASNMAWKGAVFLTTKDNLVIRASMEFSYRPDKDLNMNYNDEKWASTAPEDFWSYEVNTSRISD